MSNKDTSPNETYLPVQEKSCKRKTRENDSSSEKDSSLNESDVPVKEKPRKRRRSQDDCLPQKETEGTYKLYLRLI